MTLLAYAHSSSMLSGCLSVCALHIGIDWAIILFADVLIAQSSARTTTSAQYLSVPCFYIYTRVIVTWWTCGCAMCACAGFEFRSARVRDHWPLGEHHYWRVRGGGGGGGEGGYEREADRMISTTTKTINRGDIQCPKSCAIHPSSSSSSNSRAVHTSTIRFTDYALVTLFLSLSSLIPTLQKRKKKNPASLMMMMTTIIIHSIQKLAVGCATTTVSSSDIIKFQIRII